MKNLMKKLSRVDRHDRREELENDAAEQIKAAGSQAPPEVQAAAWASAASPAVAPEALAAPVAHAGAAPAAPGAPQGRRLTVQERMAARELQHR
jgi:hypothetical protein